ncbi:MAG: prolyl oligopeptidase family serine peptidase, partial [Balneolaceae bacterium]|nr:prolyl oligopeptidase family serine peptidase [Balneolaceae bacterium]
PNNTWWSNFKGDFREGEPIRLADRPSKPLQLTMEVLDQVLADAPADSSRIYITGLSMGGFGTWDAIARWPERFAAALPVCGGGDPTTAGRIAGVPIWAIHGADDPIVPPELSRQMIQALRDAGANPGYTEYPSVGHYSWVHSYSDPRVMSWMFSQRKQ